MCSSHTKKTQWAFFQFLDSMSCWLKWNALISDRHKQTLPSVIARIQCNLFCAQCVLEKHFLWQSQGNILTPEAKGWWFRKPAGARAGVVSTDNSTRVQETHSAVFTAGVPESWPPWATGRTHTGYLASAEGKTCWDWHTDGHTDFLHFPTYRSATCGMHANTHTVKPLSEKTVTNAVCWQD